jgi:hypothetical protein
MSSHVRGDPALQGGDGVFAGRAFAARPPRIQPENVDGRRPWRRLEDAPLSCLRAAPSDAYPERLAVGRAARPQCRDCFTA